MVTSTQITFFQRFEQDILNGSKTITIRDQSESHYQAQSIVDVFTNETQRWFAKIRILSVTPITFEQLNSQHAAQENMTLPQLQTVIREIYPNETALFVIQYELIK
ncbi:ASCH domain-containing protein [Testudinibacter sp. TR-2022]|uniref:N(4)-acetylcytidine aminohydrolase n=1 Tax=Testudinibacter sp. TR-2022 TaxID=2585029 RepID=UPI00111922EE|nr:N(4)-acetylcytidine aminohydrolase [Testudinibacter sp. TR-2022]TNH03257.1 ASCH domain-containing protein [Pasteurellaceae bacterium Phil31]TNH10924.1 ASCH domain-containing protein [Testudinibacter sp. TR-2022]TNH12291.1 ASCH domain-containing protein [Testudinibacter sp. TR-2022]TNH15029.1 ASCH domain-containing protein [Testudinibacter sp. TR-2022]TNH20504.1 ASCH domain-containing protein [Testudinibacter sp. TR-2022]